VFEVGVLQLHHPDGQVFAFEPGSLSMAFAITGAPFDESRFETLRNPEDLGRWAGAILDVPRINASTSDLTQAKRLRSAIWGGVDAVIDGLHPAAADRHVLNEAAGQAPLRPHLEPDGSSTWLRPVTPAAVLSSVASDAIDVISGPRAARLKRCQGLNCAIPFLDTSRPGTRRWCSMERCGNRAKARTHYQRQRQEVSR
jgi:predicted RNA-binding Zn ribbon-like protein